MAYETKDFVTARTFIRALRKSNRRWSSTGAWQSPWVFRGVADADWHLEPSAWRTTAYTSLYEKYANSSPALVGEFVSDISDEVETYQNGGLLINARQTANAYAQIRYEHRLIRKFAEKINEAGLALPDGRLPMLADFKYQSSAVLPVVTGLAQHHSVPTRLLDWSENPMKAIHFAAKSVEAVDENKRLAVWAWNIEEPKMHWRVFRVLRSQIGFLNAQEGLFSYLPNAATYYCRNGRWPRMDDEDQGMNENSMKKFTLPQSEAKECLRLLNLEGITPYGLMPTFDNMSASVLSDLNLMKNSVRDSE